MFWIQSKISSIVNPNFHRGANKVAKTFTPYQTLNSIEFPAEFSGKEAVTATLKGLDACHSGAEALPGLLTGIGHGMSLQDSRSFADLLSLFKTTQDNLTETDWGAILFQNTGYKATPEEIQTILANERGDLITAAKETGAWIWDKAKNFGAGFFSGAIQYGQETFTGAKEAGAWIWDKAKKFGAGFFSGAIQYGQETFTGAASAIAFGFSYVTCFIGTGGDLDETYTLATKAAAITNTWASGFELDKKWDLFMESKGIDTNSLSYRAGKVTGNVVTSAVVSAAVPGGAAYSIITAGTTTYGATLKDNIASHGGYNNMTDDELRRANTHALKVGGISAGAAAVSTVVNKHSPLTLKTKGDITAGGVGGQGVSYWVNQRPRIAGNVIANTAIGVGANYATQKADVEYGKKDRVSRAQLVAHGGASAVSALTSAVIKGNTKQTTPQIKQEQADFKESHRNTNIIKTGVDYLVKEIRKDNYVTNNVIKTGGTATSKAINKAGDLWEDGTIPNIISNLISN